MRSYRIRAGSNPAMLNLNLTTKKLTVWTLVTMIVTKYASMKTINCLCGQSILLDDTDFDYYSQFQLRCGIRAGVNFYRNYRTVYLGRDLLGLNGNLTCDHINKNKHDNQRRNLRVATQQQNNCNVNRRKDNTSGYKGVYFNKPIQKYVALIKVNGKRKHLGCFVEAVNAAKAYDEAAKQFHGEFAATNF